MNLPPEAINEIQELFQSEFGIFLSDAEALTEAEDLLRLVALSRGQRDVF